MQCLSRVEIASELVYVNGVSRHKKLPSVSIDKLAPIGLLLEFQAVASSSKVEKYKLDRSDLYHKRNPRAFQIGTKGDSTHMCCCFNFCFFLVLFQASVTMLHLFMACMKSHTDVIVEE